MTGTSLDGLDAALVRVEGVGIGLTASLVATGGSPFPPDLARDLRAAAEQTPLPAVVFAQLALRFAAHHIDAVRTLLKAPEASGTPTPDLIVAHGQTIYHAPPCSWQLLQPTPIVEAFGITTVCDLRQADLAAGGQGAPITPLSDWVLFRSSHHRAIVNLGGFCNVTILPGDSAVERVRGADLCACNQVLDAVARRCLGRAFDADGEASMRGTPDAAGREELLRVLRAQRAAGRSLGTGDEALAWVDRIASRLRGDDAAATATAAVGQAIGEAIGEALAQLDGAAAAGRGEVILAGGGAHHRGLARCIEIAAGHPARPLDDLGVPIGAREAMAMAVLGIIAADGEPISLAAVTGRRVPRTVDGLWACARMQPSPESTPYSS